MQMKTMTVINTGPFSTMSEYVPTSSEGPLEVDNCFTTGSQGQLCQDVDVVYHICRAEYPENYTSSRRNWDDFKYSNANCKKKFGTQLATLVTHEERVQFYYAKFMADWWSFFDTPADIPPIKYSKEEVYEQTKDMIVVGARAIYYNLTYNATEDRRVFWQNGFDPDKGQGPDFLDNSGVELARNDPIWSQFPDAQPLWWKELGEDIAFDPRFAKYVTCMVIDFSDVQGVRNAISVEPCRKSSIFQSFSGQKPVILEVKT